MSIESVGDSLEPTAGPSGWAIAPARVVRKARGWFSTRDWFLLWLIPLVGSLLLWQGVPILSSLGLSFTDYYTGESLSKVSWVGLHNYSLAFQDPVFQAAIKNTLYLAAVGVPVMDLLALLIAQLLFSVRRGSGFFRSLAFLPVITSPMATIILFQYLYQTQYGLFNQILGAVGLPRVNWLSDPAVVKPAIIALMIWNFVGYSTIILLAGLGTIPEVLSEAARIDGANSWQVFWRITMPLMRRPLAFVFVTDGIHWMQIFAQPEVLTKGGPHYSSLTAVIQIQRVGLIQFRGGAASALAFILFLFILVLTLVQLRFFRTEWEY
jgi:multiple sugar transport system permease protein